jgi:bifunctional DNase/RNase
MNLIQVAIGTLSTSAQAGNAYMLVLNEVDGQRRLPIIIGAFEAQAIAFGLENIQPPRPMTHDLLRNAIVNLGGMVTDIVIDELREGTFFAKIRYEVAGEMGQLDARPSDAVALAVRCDASIYVSEEVLVSAGMFPDDYEGEPESKVEPPPSRPAQKAPEVKVQSKSPLELVQEQLDAAIAAEDYERAARLRDELKRLREED